MLFRSAGAQPVVDLVLDGWVERIRAFWPELPAIDESAAVITTWTADDWARGSYSVVTQVDADGLHPSARPVGRIAFAGEHTAPEGWTATIEGALRSGVRAAEQVLAL